MTHTQHIYMLCVLASQEGGRCCSSGRSYGFLKEASTCRIETLRDIGGQGVRGLLLNRDDDRPDGVVDGASGSASVAVRCAPCFPLWLKDECDEGLECPLRERGDRERAVCVLARLRHPHTADGAANGQLTQMSRPGTPLGGRERLYPVHPRRVLALLVLGDATDCEQLRSPRLQEEVLESLDSAAISRARGFVAPPFALEHRYLQLAPGELVPCIRRRCRLAHAVCTLLGSSPCRSTARLSAYPPACPEAWASDVLPPRAPDGWYLLRRMDRPRRGRTGVLRSRVGCGDERRVGKLRRDPCGVQAGHAENRRPKVRCPFGSSVSAACAGSTYRRFHSLPGRPLLHLYWRYHRVRLPVSPCSLPLRGLMASRDRGACVSTPHQGRPAWHRHPKRVLRLSSVSSFFYLRTNPPS
jgi:hypothetical protein